MYFFLPLQLWADTCSNTIFCSFFFPYPSLDPHSEVNNASRMGWNPDKKVKIACVTIPGSKFSPEQNNGNGIMTFQTLKRGRFFILSRSVLFFLQVHKKPLQEEHWYKTFLCDDKNAFLTIMSYHIFLFAPRLLNKKKSPWKSKYKLAGITRENAKFWKKGWKLKCHKMNQKDFTSKFFIPLQNP